MYFGVNKTPVEIIREGAFGGKFFKDIYSGIKGKWYKKSRKKLDQLKYIDQKFYCSDYYDVRANEYGIKRRTSLRLWEYMGWINEVDPYGWFQWYSRNWLVRRSEDDERQIN